MTKEFDILDRKTYDACVRLQNEVNMCMSTIQHLAYLQRAERGVMKVAQKNTVVWCVENASESLKLS
jgi:hypothetical protein